MHWSLERSTMKTVEPSASSPVALKSPSIELCSHSGESSLHTTNINLSGSPSIKLKHQINEFSIDIEQDNSIIPKKYQCSKPWLIAFAVTMGILLILENTINVWYLKSVIFTLLPGLLGFACLISYLVKFNVFVMKQGLQSFAVWYTVIHAIIATFSRQIYYGFWTSIDDIYTDYPPNVNNNNVLYILSGTVAAINVSILVFSVSFIDAIVTKSNVIKRVSLILTILLCLWYWIETYFNIYGDYIVNEQLSIKIFNQRHQVSWRAITLSSFFKTIAFVSAQLFLNCKYPNKVNVIPLPVKINRIEFIENENYLETFQDLSKNLQKVVPTEPPSEPDSQPQTPQPQTPQTTQTPKHPMQLTRSGMLIDWLVV